MYHSFLIHSSADGNLGCFHVLAIINSAVMNIGVHVSLSLLVSSVCMPSSGIAGSYGSSFFFFILIYFIFKLYIIVISFAKYQNESATGIHVFPILNPPPSSLPISSLWVVPVHQPQASSIVHRTWTGTHFIHDILHVSMSFSQIFPPSPSPTESIRLVFHLIFFSLYCYL